MKHTTPPLLLLALVLVLALAATAAPAQTTDSAADSLRFASAALERFYDEPFAVHVPPDPGPRRSYSGLALFTGSTALANALVVAGNTRSNALAAGGLTFGVLSLIASMSERTVARPMHFVLGVTSIVLSIMNQSNAPDTSGPGDVQSVDEYKGAPVGFSISF